MSGKMSVIYVPDTGHAVAAVSRTSDPAAAFDLTHLGGDSVIVKNANTVPAPLTGGGEEFFVPSSVLKVTSQPIDLDEGLLFMPLTYALDHDTPHLIGSPLPSPPPPATLVKDKITISVTSPLSTAADLTIWSQVQEMSPIVGTSPEIRISTGVLPKNSLSVDIQLTGSPGGTPITLPSQRTYYLLLLVAEYQPFFSTTPI
jgi:hypothetical protein